MSVDMIPINKHIASLSNLEKLTLRNTNFEWKGINVISRLPKLKAKSGNWPEEEVFSQLTYLGINSIDLKQWKTAAKQIETDQRDNGNDDMIVIEENTIQPNDEPEADEDDFDEL
nr:putative late blight resistance protein homolog R1B-14 [Ipomoea batatas]